MMVSSKKEEKTNMGLCLYRCNTCGKVIVVMENKMDTDTICCGSPMEKIAPQTEGEEIDEHLPCVNVTHGIAHVRVGKVLHPLEEDNHIKIIALSFSDGFYVKYLSACEKPELEVPVGKGRILKSVYSYCNKHGWWKYTLCHDENLKKCKK